MTIDELWIVASEYGLPRLSTMDDGTYHASIKFRTTIGIALEARSNFNHTTPTAALQMAIEKAQEIAGHIVKEAEHFKALSKA